MDNKRKRTDDESPGPTEGNGGNEFRKRKNRKKDLTGQSTPPPIPRRSTLHEESPGSTISRPTQITGQSTPPRIPPRSAVPEGSPGSFISRPTQMTGISSNGDKAIQVRLDVNNGEYTLKLISVPIENAIAEKAHTAAMLLSQADVLRELGEQLLSQIRASFRSECYESLNIQQVLS